MANTPLTRRAFLGAAGAAAAFTIVPRRVLGGEGQRPPSETLGGALIGCGRRGGGSWKAMGLDEPRLLARCDVDTKHLGGPADNKERYTDFRRLLERKDIDFVCIATPPHWHALISIAAAQAGKDIFCEKPMTKFIAEGRAVADAVRKHGVVFQIGTFGRFGQRASKGALECHQVMASGLLKDASRFIQRGTVPMRLGKTHLEPQPVPAELDYDLWLGPAPYKPYNEARVHYSNRFYWDYEGGDLANFGAHRLDPFQWTFAKDATSPVQATPHAPWPQHPDAVGPWGWVELKYADGLRFILETGKWGDPYAEKGSGQPGLKDLDPADQEKVKAMPDPPPLVSFKDAIRTRRQPGGNADASHRAATVLHLANIAIRMGRTIRYDPVKEQIVGDPAANRFVNIPMRAPWHL